MNDKWYTSKELKEMFGISSQLLYYWRKKNKIEYTRINESKFIYKLPNWNSEKRNNVIYCRVSNTKQKNDLMRQEKILREYCTSNGIVVDSAYKDIASGMNTNRRMFSLLLSDVCKNKIDTVYITFKDRLTRFGFDYFERVFNLHKTKIKVINLTQEEDYQNELTQDLISIIHHFSMKMYSNRRKQLKEIEKQLKEKQW